MRKNGVVARARTDGFKNTLAIVLLVMTACTYEKVWGVWGLTNCPTEMQRSDLRVRSSAMRAGLADEGKHLGKRLGHYAAMAAASYSYANQHRAFCVQPRNKEHRDDSKWVDFLYDNDWEEATSSIYRNWPYKACEEDNVGFYARAWRRTQGSRDEVVVSFRGTNSRRDWASGNLMWFRGKKNGNNQYTRARELIRHVIDHYDIDKKAETQSIELRTTGHSLGGGLAQHALYSEPTHVLQAYAFHPSPVTGYWFYPDKGKEERRDRRRESCSAAQGLEEEARIFRIYERGEILAYVRFPLKIVNPISRHISEIQTQFYGGHFLSRHSISKMAKKLISAETDGDGWLTTNPPDCESSFRERQSELYEMPNDKTPCPNR